MSAMFWSATAFNQPLTFDTSQVTTMSHMFMNAEAFNQPLTFDTSQVTNMRHMFVNTTAFNQPLNWNTSKVTDMQDMFDGATSFNNGGQVLTFDTSQVTDMDLMFEYEGEAISRTRNEDDTDSKTDDEGKEGKEGEAVQCTDEDKQLCAVCMFSCVDTVLVPCGHACLCRRCAKRVQWTYGKCPICRVPIQRILKLYLTGINHTEQ
jgi:hypothetical protein